MNIYAESSAVAAWLLRERQSADIYTLLVAATHVISSDLTVVECSRAIYRGAALGRISRQAAKLANADLTAAAAKWDVIGLLPSVVQRARQPFLNEPIRTLDALHVSWALHARAAITDLAVLSLDDRVRRVAESAGFELFPK